MSTWFTLVVAAAAIASAPSGSYGDEVDDPLVFMPPYRCLDRAFMNGPRGRLSVRRDIRDLMEEMNGEAGLNSRAECGVIDPSMCKEEGQNYPINCNCHAYFTCNILDASLVLKPCPHWCEPRGLVFDSNTQVCVKIDQAPPGICIETPTTPDPDVSTTPEAPTTTPYVPTTTPYVPTTTPYVPTTTPKAPTTTPEPTTTTTTPKPTTTPAPTTTPKPTTTPPKPTTTTAAPTTTPNAAVDCDFDGQKLPYPGNCHWYYVCFEDGNGSDNYHVEVYDCGDTWVYDPNTGSCTWPEEADDELCNY